MRLLKSAVKPLMIFSTVVILSGCGSCLKEIEKKHKVYALNTVHGVCHEYKIISVKDKKFEWVQDKPIGFCDGMFAVSPEALNDIRNCAEDTAKNCSFAGDKKK